MGLEWGWSLKMRGKQSAPPVVNPLTILGSDLNAWWTADDPTSFDLNGSQVTAWRDQSRTLALAQGSSAARPVYQVDGFGGSPCIYFDGVDDNLNNAGAHGLPAGATAGEIWAIASQDFEPSNGGARIMFCYGGTGGNRRTIGRIASGGNKPEARAGTGSGETTVATDGDFTGRHRIRGLFTPVSVGIGIDGSSPSIAPVNLAGTLTTGVTIGATTTPSAWWKGGIRDIIVTMPLDTTKAAALAAWLDARRNL